jgi:hypothetical protein
MESVSGSGHWYSVSVISPKAEEAQIRDAVKEALESFFQRELAALPPLQFRDVGTFPLDPVTTTIILSFLTSVAANEVHSPKWLPACRQFLRSQFGASVEIKEDER